LFYFIQQNNIRTDYDTFKGGGAMKLDWSQVAKNGIFAILFVWLLYFTITENSQREAELKQIIQEQNAVMGKMSDIIRMDLAEIKAYIIARANQ
jgi:hypothetical protein